VLKQTTLTLDDAMRVVTTAIDYANGDPGQVVFNGGAGNNTLIVRSGSYSFSSQSDTANLTVSLDDGATIVFDGSYVLTALEIGPGSVARLAAGGDSVLVLNDLQISTGASGWDGRLDLADNAMILRYVGPSPIDRITDQIRSARGTSAPWDGNGITSSVAALDQQFALGSVDNAALGLSTFLGHDIDTSSILIRFTYVGDANLDGRVSIADLSILASNWQQSDRSWFHGDFDYSGTVTIADLSLLASNWQAGVPSGSTGSGMSFGEALAMFDVFDGVVIPEPTALITLAMTLLALRRRRLVHRAGGGQIEIRS
jgi:hypothetical protein